MKPPKDFQREQRDVALSMAAALIITIMVLGIAWMADQKAASPPFIVRLQSIIRADLFVVLWPAAAIANVARLRFFSQRDIVGSGVGAGSEKVRSAGAILQNTFEQASLAVFAHLAVAATLGRSTSIITALVVLFAIGRLLFWAGYDKGARGRAFGFALTFYPTVLALFSCAVGILFGLPA